MGLIGQKNQWGGSPQKSMEYGQVKEERSVWNMTKIFQKSGQDQTEGSIPQSASYS